jgi:DNA (cytosine-5)-methyltransferase 1
MRHGSLFSGIGGFDLAAEWCGWENVFQVEIDEFAQKVLAYHFPNVKRYSDVKEFDGTPYKGAVDVISGGFPCQPYSNAGKRKGKNDDRHLWPEMLRIIREISPTYVVGENVYGLYSWNDGMVFDEIISDLETLGYEVRPVFIPAVAVNAPHRRMRIWFVAYANGAGSRGNGGTSRGTQSEVRRQDASDVLEPFRHDGVAANAEMPRGARERISQSRKGQFNRRDSRAVQTDFEQFPTQSPICGGDDGISRQLDGITFPKWRAESIKAYGNAIVPQVAYQIFEAIKQTHNQ